MDELLELIIRGIIKLFEGSGKKKSQPSTLTPAQIAQQQAEWQRRRKEWEEQQRRQAAAALAGAHAAAPPQIPAQPRRHLAESAAGPLASAGGSRPLASAPSAKAASIHRWAQPKNLRSQFILTEVLKPPLSLREPRRQMQ